MATKLFSRVSPVLEHARTRLRAGTWLALLATAFVLLVGWALPHCALAQARPQQAVVNLNSLANFPHVAAYVRLAGDGHQLDSDAMVAKLARFTCAVIPASPATETYPNRLAQLRALNPNIRLIAYFPGDFMWDGSGYANGNVYGDCWKMFAAHDWWLYASDGTPFRYFGNTFDLTNPVAQDSLAAYLATRVLGSGVWDGIFLDDFCESNWWKQTFNGQFMDQNRDGIPDAQSVIDPLWKAGTDSLAAKLRRLVGPNLPVVGNCAYGSKWTTMNGWMREDFPRQGTWTTNMFSASGGYLVNEQNFLSPHFNFVYSTSEPRATMTSSTNLAWMRFGLGSAMLGDGYFMFDPQDGAETVQDFWFDEYDNAGAGGGYLGQPLGAYYQQVGTLGTTERFTNTGFEGTLTPWIAYNIVGSTALDATTFTEGATSVRVGVPSATLYTTQVHLRQTVSLPSTVYSVTFWAKAASPRTMWVQAQRTTSPNTIYCYQPVTLTTSWRQYQATFTQNSGGPQSVEMQLQFGQQIGDVWVDDVHLQSGASSCYRRDFDNGTVLVNPSSLNVTIQLEKPFKRIQGSQEPQNNGAVVSSLTLGGSDAVLLLNASGDVTPPAPVGNLQVTVQPH